jgi:hypothetical protein
MLFFFIKCKYCIDQKEQDKLVVQAGTSNTKKTYKSRQREQANANHTMRDWKILL